MIFCHIRNKKTKVIEFLMPSVKKIKSIIFYDFIVKSHKKSNDLSLY